MTQPFRVIRGLGGNGGTFLCRVIAAMQNVVLLSETNPLTANLFRYALNPAVQIERNYGNKGFAKYAGHIAELGAPSLFGEYVSGLREACDKGGLHLVIRDYNYVDYVGSPFVWSLPRHSSLNAALKGTMREIVLLRHPVPQFLSLRSHAELARALDYRVFLDGYRRLLEMHGDALWLKYETMFSTFDRLINEIADELEIPFDESWPARLPEITWITGSQAAKNKQRPESPPEIWPHGDPQLRQLFLAEESYRKICELCGYEP
jgi:hypothetical protein